MESNEWNKRASKTKTGVWAPGTDPQLLRAGGLMKGGEGIGRRTHMRDPQTPRVAWGRTEEGQGLGGGGRRGEKGTTVTVLAVKAEKPRPQSDD